MNVPLRVALALGLLSCAACSSVIEGRTQDIAVSTDPPGASCVLWREDKPIAKVEPTPDTVWIRKSKYDINIVCDKSGYVQASYLNKSDVAGATVGNILLGGGIGWAVDSATGADNKYESKVNLTMTPASAPPEKTAANPGS